MMKEGALPVLVIPAYQPSSELLVLVDQLLALNFESIVVINDGSASEKNQIFDAVAKKPGVTVLHHSVNRGKGAALKTAFRHILERHEAISGVVTLDADGQHLPADVLKVAQALKQNKNALIMGVREFVKREGGKIPVRSIFGNLLNIYVMRWMLRQDLQDTMTGLRGIPVSLMKESLDYPTDRFEFEVEMLISASNGAAKILQVPIATVYKDGNRGSHYRPVVDSLRISVLYARWSLRRVRNTATGG